MENDSISVEDTGTDTQIQDSSDENNISNSPPKMLTISEDELFKLIDQRASTIANKVATSRAKKPVSPQPVSPQKEMADRIHDLEAKLFAQEQKEKRHKLESKLMSHLATNGITDMNNQRLAIKSLSDQFELSDDNETLVFVSGDEFLEPEYGIKQFVDKYPALVSSKQVIGSGSKTPVSNKQLPKEKPTVSDLFGIKK